MLNTPWIALLKKVPPEHHNQLVLMTTSGTEMAVQTILILEGECLVFKGRLSGCQDAGRLFYVPYDRIDYLGFSRVVTEEEFRAWYGEAAGSSAAGAGANGANPGSGPRPASVMKPSTPGPEVTTSADAAL